MFNIVRLKQNGLYLQSAKINLADVYDKSKLHTCTFNPKNEFEFSQLWWKRTSGEYVSPFYGKFLNNNHLYFFENLPIKNDKNVYDEEQVIKERVMWDLENLNLKEFKKFEFENKDKKILFKGAHKSDTEIIFDYIKNAKSSRSPKCFIIVGKVAAGKTFKTKEIVKKHPTILIQDQDIILNHIPGYKYLNNLPFDTQNRHSFKWVMNKYYNRANTIARFMILHLIYNKISFITYTDNLKKPINFYENVNSINSQIDSHFLSMLQLQKYTTKIFHIKKHRKTRKARLLKRIHTFEPTNGNFYKFMNDKIQKNTIKLEPNKFIDLKNVKIYKRNT